LFCGGFIYRAIINTFLFNGVKVSEIKVKRTNKRLRSKRIKRICRFVDSVSVCIHMHTELLLNLGSCSVVTGLEGFSSMLVCFTFIIYHTDISTVLSPFLRYIGEYFTLGSRIVFVTTRISYY